jgi:hypothetical protein
MISLRNFLVYFLISVVSIMTWHIIFRLETSELTWGFDLTRYLNYIIFFNILLFIFLNLKKIKFNNLILFYFLFNILFILLNIQFANPSLRFIFFWVFWSIGVLIFSLVILNDYEKEMKIIYNFLFKLYLPFSFFIIIMIIYYAGPLGTNILPGALISQHGYNEISHSNSLTNNLWSELWFQKHAFGWCFLFLIAYSYYIKKLRLLPLILITFLIMNRSLLIGFLGFFIIKLMYSNMKQVLKLIIFISSFLGLVIFIYLFKDQIVLMLSSDSRWTLLSILPHIIIDYPFGLGLGTFHLPETNQLLIDRYSDQLFLDNYLARFPHLAMQGWIIPPVTESNIVLFISSFGIFFFICYITFFSIILHKLFNKFNELDSFSKFILCQGTIILIAGIGEDFAHEWYYWLNSGFLIGLYYKFNHTKKVIDK